MVTGVFRWSWWEIVVARACCPIVGCGRPNDRHRVLRLYGRIQTLDNVLLQFCFPSLSRRVLTTVLVNLIFAEF